MAKTLVIAEKYLAACDMAKILECPEEKEGYLEGEEYIITWTDGHLIGFQYPEEYNPDYKKWRLEDLPLQFDPEVNLKVLPEKQKQFAVVKRLIQGTETDRIINAGDAGREGYLVQYWVYKMAGNKKPVKVLWASSLAANALIEAFANLHDDEEFNGVLEEALARAELDDIMGMNYSRLLTLRCSNDGVTLPYGRCMTTLLNCVVQREQEISLFQTHTTYGIEVAYKPGFKGTMIDPEGKTLIFESRGEAESILSDIQGSGTVIDVERTKTMEKAPLLFSLPDLQACIGAKYKYSPQMTLKIAQSLYEKRKLISYPRTDSGYLSSDLRTEIEKSLECCRFGKFKAALSRCEKVLPVDEMYFNDEEITDHHAIIPVVNNDMQQIYYQLSEEEKNVFDEIVYRFLAMFAQERVTKSVKLQVLLNGYLFRSTESMEVEAGYKLLRRADKGESWSEFFENVKNGDVIELAAREDEEIDCPYRNQMWAEIKEKKSNPPSRFTYATIIELMKAKHIGTPATMAATLEKLQGKDAPMLVVKNGKYYSTPFGKAYISIVPEELKMPELSIEMESKLEQIRKGELSRQEFIRQVKEALQENIEKTDFQKKSFKRCFQIKRSSKSNYKKRRADWG